jgi:hypothetical protein
MTGNHKTDLDAIKLHIETWKAIGKVPFPRRHIEGKFNKILDALFEKLSSSKKKASNCVLLIVWIILQVLKTVES